MKKALFSVVFLMAISAFAGSTIHDQIAGQTNGYKVIVSDDFTINHSPTFFNMFFIGENTTLEFGEKIVVLMYKNTQPGYSEMLASALTAKTIGSTSIVFDPTEANQCPEAAAQNIHCYSILSISQNR